MPLWSHFLMSLFLGAVFWMGSLASVLRELCSNSMGLVTRLTGLSLLRGILEASCKWKIFPCLFKGKVKVVSVLQTSWVISQKELEAAKMCAELMQSVSKSLRHFGCNLHFWSNSQVV